MITIRKPNPYTIGLYSPSGIGFGPFPLRGSLFVEEKFRHTSDFLLEDNGFYGDNQCHQRQFSGVVSSELYLKDTNPKSHYSSISMIRVDAFGNLLPNSTTLMKKYQLLSSYDWFCRDTGTSGTLHVEKKFSPSKIATATTYWYGRSGGHRLYRVVLNIFETPHVDGLVDKLPVRHESYLRDINNPDWACPFSGRPAFLESIMNELFVHVTQFEPTVTERTDQVYGHIPREFKRISYDSVKTTVSNSLTPVLDVDLPHVDIKSHGELSIDAIDTLDYTNVNIFEFLSGMRKPWELLPKLRNLGTLKNAAENYLTIEYGVLPTVDDLKKIFESITQLKTPYYDSRDFQVLTAGSRGYASAYGIDRVITKRVKIAIDTIDNELVSIQERMRSFGGFPSIDNLYELIPFSFVLDWFVNVGDILESLDNRQRMASLPIRYSTISTKDVSTFDVSKLAPFEGLSGEIQLVHYDRVVSLEAPRPPLSFEVSNSLPTKWLEAAALIVANKK